MEDLCLQVLWFNHLLRSCMTSGIFNLRQQPKILVRREWQPQQKTDYVECFVVAGGGGGGSSANLGTGGGAGGVINTYTPVVNGSSVTVTVGGGGSANANGSNSVFGNIVSIGGGRGGAAGGSGGGSFGSTSIPGGVYGQGFSGSPSGPTGDSGEDPGGGGGGAGTPGQQGANGDFGGSGGVGVGSWIRGSNAVYAGGGGGCLQNGTFGGWGGWGGGGNGVSFSSGSGSPAAVAGTVNTGGGGGGGGSPAAGGSGIVVVRYPSNFAAPTATTGSPTVSTTGVGSISFNGTTQRFQYTNNAAFQFGTGSFLVDAWIYPTALTAYRVIAKCSSDSSWADGWSFVTNTAGIDFWINGSQTLTSGGAGLTLNTWQHVAAVRNGSTLTLYINGVSVATTSNSTNIVPTAPLTIAAETSNNFMFAGNMTNLRIVKGAAVYTANFTPPEYPSYPVSGTSLLLNCPSISYNKDFSGNNFVPSSVSGPPTWSSSIPYVDLSIQNRVYTWTSSGSITF
jgi:hypothetical protein